MSRDLGCCPSMSLFLLVVDLERHVKNFLVLSLVGLEPIQLVAEVLLLIQQLLQTIRQDNVGIIKTAVLLVEMIVVVDDLCVRV